MRDSANVDAERPGLEAAKNECAADIGDRHRRLANDFDSRASDSQARLRIGYSSAHLGGNLCVDRRWSRTGHTREQQTDDYSRSGANSMRTCDRLAKKQNPVLACRERGRGRRGQRTNERARGTAITPRPSLEGV